MTIDRKKIRWNGWGWIEAPDLLGERAGAVWDWMAREVGLPKLPETPAKPIEEIALPPSRLSAQVLGKITEAVAPDRVKTDAYERVFHARGKSYLDLLHLRSGQIDVAPDAVVYPVSASEILNLLALAEGAGIAIVPFGGGSSVVGGVTAKGSESATPVITLDLTLMNRVIEIDEVSMTARIEPGIYGPQLERVLQERGFTLGHYPQSFEFSTLGGWIAHRGAGQQSNKYGKAEKWLVSAKLATPRGLWTTEGFPASAAGPQLNQIVPGSEGILGIITEATVRIQRLPEVKDYQGYIFAQFDKGVAAAREIVQSGIPTAMIRLSDADETFFFTALQTIGKGGEPKARFCVMLVGLEGDAASVDDARARTRVIIERNSGVHAGETLGQGWYHSRFNSPYLRDPMLDRGLGVDTLETSIRWSDLLALHGTVIRAISESLAANAPSSGARALVMAHVSHCYPDGASLYFTFAFLRDLDREIKQWQAVKRAATEAVLAGGGTLSHHHGVGTDHAPWIEREKGPLGLAVLRSMKRELDPGGVLNPGKLLG